MISEEWIEQINKEFKENNVPHRQRAFVAYERMCLEFNDVVLSSPETEYLFNWFKKNTKANSDLIINPKSSVFLYDCEFWEFEIPEIAGSPVIPDMTIFLKNMSPNIKESLKNDVEKYEEYRYGFACCLIYSFGLNEIKANARFSKDSIEWIKSADQELSAAIKILLDETNKSRAALSLRNAMENFLKGFISLKIGLTVSTAKKIGHNLNLALDQVISLSSDSSLNYLRDALNKFPKVEKRYNHLEYKSDELYEMLVTTQVLATFVIKDFSAK